MKVGYHRLSMQWGRQVQALLIFEAQHPSYWSASAVNSKLVWESEAILYIASIVSIGILTFGEIVKNDIHDHQHKKPRELQHNLLTVASRLCRRQSRFPSSGNASRAGQRKTFGCAASAEHVEDQGSCTGGIGKRKVSD